MADRHCSHPTERMMREQEISKRAADQKCRGGIAENIDMAAPCENWKCEKQPQYRKRKSPEHAEQIRKSASFVFRSFFPHLTPAHNPISFLYDAVKSRLFN